MIAIVHTDRGQESEGFSSTEADFDCVEGSLAQHLRLILL